MSEGEATQHPGADPGCDRCRGAGFVVGSRGAYAEAEACTCVGTVCRVCGGTGFVASSDAYRAARRRCRCHALSTRIRAFNAVGIPARHAASTRTSFDKTGPRMTGFLGVESYLKRWRPAGGNRGLILFGRVGRGKTHLMCALLQELVLRKGAQARFVEFSHLLADLKSGFDVGQGTASTMGPLLDIGVLAIDELGKGRNTEFEGTVVDELVSRRYNAMLPLVATTNFGIGPPSGVRAPNLAGGPLPALVDRIGDRVYSRLRETCDFVELRGPDFREERRGAGA